MQADREKRGGLFSYLATFSLSFGCMIGWGFFVMPGVRLIPRAGVMGVLIGVLVAALIAQIICSNYIGLARTFSGATNTYSIIKNIFGADHAFFSAWSLLLAYVCILWANVDAIAYLGRLFFMSTPFYSTHYTFMGFNVYPGDIILSTVILILGALVVDRGYKVALKVLSVLCVILFVLIIAMFGAVISASDIHTVLSPSFSSVSSMPKSIQVIAIAVMAPWIFVGFETVTHAVFETKISLARIFIISGCAIIVVAVLLCLMTLMINAGVPDGFRSWEDYSVLSGGVASFADLPAFYSVQRVMGAKGILILMAAFLCALFGSVIGYFMAATKTIKILADDGMAPKALTKMSKTGIPYNALYLVLVFSVPFMFMGMNMLGWALDISSLTICIVYGYISIGAFLQSAESKFFKVNGIIGTLCAFSIFLLIIIPNTIIGSSLVKEDYLILSIWSLAGLICYRFVLFVDKKNRLGRSMLTWLLMFFLLFYSTNMWTHLQMEEDLFLAGSEAEISSILLTDNLIRTVVVVVALIILFELFSIMLKREKALGREVSSAREKYNAKNSLINDLSHDIRTPMNAIVGFADLALSDTSDNEKMVDHLKNIRLSGTHLLTLLNDMMAMNRIENDTFELKEENINLPELLSHLRKMTSAAAHARDHELVVDVHPLDNENVVTDRSSLIHVLSCFTSNAIKNTPDGGKVVVGVMQLAHSEDGRAMYEFFIKDAGGGYYPEGMSFSVAQKIIDVMGGRIEVEPEPGTGTEVFITMDFAVSSIEVKKEDEDFAIDLSGKRALVVDDILVNRQIAAAMLEMYGMETEEAADGFEALKLISSSLPGHFDVILMDIEMPGLNGFDAVKKIRHLYDPVNASVPVFAMTANVLDEDKKQAFDVGMNGFIEKPINREYMISSIAEVIRENRGDVL